MISFAHVKALIKFAQIRSNFIFACRHTNLNVESKRSQPRTNSHGTYSKLSKHGGGGWRGGSVKTNNYDRGV